MELLIGELPLLILSLLRILVDLFVFAVFLYFRYIVKVDADGMNYLGLFSAAMGLWKLMDLKCMSLLFPTQVIVMNYTRIGASLSTEQPSMTRAKLFQLADEEMHRNKQFWYRQNKPIHNTGVLI